MSEQSDVMGTGGECHAPLTLTRCKKSPPATPRNSHRIKSLIIPFSRNKVEQYAGA